ncbi:unnamed protein product, partial [Symbiodinium necroappetens]
RLRVLCANLDGMTTVVYDHMVKWMQTAPYDIIFLQETHRGFGSEPAEWKAGQWTFVSSPDPSSRFAGVAIAIRTTVAEHYTARSAAVIPGRLLHVRLSGDAYGIDLLSCYQHVITNREARTQNASKREHFWTQLGRPLEASVPLKPGWTVVKNRTKPALRERVKNALREAEQHTADSLNSILLQACVDQFPPVRKAGDAESGQERQIGPLFQATGTAPWHRKQLLQRKLELATQAEQNKDVRLLYAVVRLDPLLLYPGELQASLGRQDLCGPLTEAFHYESVA